MGKAKQDKLMAIPKKKGGLLSDMDSDGEDSWVIVKKQAVTILIPPLPHAKKTIAPKEGPTEFESVPIQHVSNNCTEHIETLNTVPSVDEQEKVTSVVPNTGSIMSKTVLAQHTSASRYLPRVKVETATRNPDRSNSLKSHNVLGVSNISKTIKLPRLWYDQQHFLDGSALLNQSLRASLLEKKLQKAGGLRRWLSSIGLGQFVNMFQGNISKFQLVNLTMKKLKDMGADAVGPRRKLIHAIDCICQPYCFEAR
ncbi:uncharacterized protein LOC126679490 [Mercurialis annua]|uniref:uncharacterized protein LOC126679490 n=1 Tax=Mercurialis annua TaxID=3986 RepID=UPI00215DD998|nr:uncharacterized protein LOC126679490 [Mercurialis annua]XP_055961602.1 uncharacterized protein LOC126679490 [Mercurialis annua]